MSSFFSTFQNDLRTSSHSPSFRLLKVSFISFSWDYVCFLFHTVHTLLASLCVTAHLSRPSSFSKPEWNEWWRNGKLLSGVKMERQANGVVWERNKQVSSDLGKWSGRERKEEDGSRSLRVKPEIPPDRKQQRHTQRALAVRQLRINLSSTYIIPPSFTMEMGKRENTSSIQKGHLLHYYLFLVFTSISFARRNTSPSLCSLFSWVI